MMIERFESLEMWNEQRFKKLMYPKLLNTILYFYQNKLKK